VLSDRPAVLSGHVSQ